MRWYALAWLGMGFAMGNDTAVNSAASAPHPVGEFKGEESVIRMVSEKIDIVFGRERSKVHCRFVFRSTKEKGDARQIVGFPDMVGESDSGRILSMTTRMDGREVEAKVRKGYFINEDFSPRGVLGPPPSGGVLVTEAEYHTIEVAFPPDKDVVIERMYVVENGGSVMGNTTFSYTTLTGAIWHGTIGRAEFNVTLDGWTLEDLAFEDGPQKLKPREQMVFCSPNRADWKIEASGKMSLVWEDFEPAVHKSRREVFLTTWNTRSE